jgi:hypothetical protein
MSSDGKETGALGAGLVAEPHVHDRKAIARRRFIGAMVFLSVRDLRVPAWPPPKIGRIPYLPSRSVRPCSIWVLGAAKYLRTATPKAGAKCDVMIDHQPKELRGIASSTESERAVLPVERQLRDPPRTTQDEYEFVLDNTVRQGLPGERERVSGRCADV